MADEINFMDLAALLSIGPDTTLEKLGSAINASIFDASNIAGSLKQKGLIDFTASYPGPNSVTVTDTGKALIAEAESKAGAQFDDLDNTILIQVSGGKRIPADLQNTLNIRPRDLALRIYKLHKQGFVTYDLKSGGVVIMLTDSGFLKSKASAGAPIQKPAQVQQQDMQPQAKSSSVESTNVAPQVSEEMPHGPAKRHTVLYVLVIVLIVVIAAGIYYLNYMKKL